MVCTARLLLLGEAPSAGLGMLTGRANWAGRAAGSLLCDLSHISCLEIPTTRETRDISEEESSLETLKLKDISQ